MAFWTYEQAAAEKRRLNGVYALTAVAVVALLLLKKKR